MRIEGRVVLVTGASSGIGEAVAQRLAPRGARLLLHGRDTGRLARVASRSPGTVLPGDLLEPCAVRDLANRAAAVHGRVDVVVHGAGIGWSGRLDEMPGETARRLVDLDLAAPIELTRLLLPGMLRRGSGHLCFVSSIAGRTGVAGEAVYAAAKAGLDGFAESLRAELSGTGVRVSVVVPGAVDTPFFERRGRAYDRRVPRLQPATAVADAVVQCLEQERAEAFVPRWLRVPGLVRAVSPAGFRWMSVRFGEQLPRSTCDDVEGPVGAGGGGE